MRSVAPYLNENGNRSIPENLVMTSAYARKPEGRTDFGSRDKNHTGVGKGVTDMYVPFCSGAKLTMLRATNGVARVIIEIEVPCVRLTTKLSEVKERKTSHFGGLVKLLVTLQEYLT